MDASSLPQGPSSERSRGAANPAGVYRMERPGMEPAEIITAPGDSGAIQGDALVQVGYKRVGDLPSREELLAMQKKQAAKDLAQEKLDKEAHKAELEAMAEEIVQQAKAPAEAPAPVAEAPVPAQPAPAEASAEAPAPKAAKPKK